MQRGRGTIHWGLLVKWKIAWVKWKIALEPVPVTDCTPIPVNPCPVGPTYTYTVLATWNIMHGWTNGQTHSRENTYHAWLNERTKHTLERMLTLSLERENTDTIPGTNEMYFYYSTCMIRRNGNTVHGISCMGQWTAQNSRTTVTGTNEKVNWTHSRTLQ